MTTTTNLDQINALTGFANGEKFTSEQQVRAYFTQENMLEMFGECIIASDVLSAWAEKVITRKSHCSF